MPDKVPYASLMKTAHFHLVSFPNPQQLRWEAGDDRLALVIPPAAPCDTTLLTLLPTSSLGHSLSRLPVTYADVAARRLPDLLPVVNWRLVKKITSLAAHVDRPGIQFSRLRRVTAAADVCASERIFFFFNIALPSSFCNNVEGRYNLESEARSSVSLSVCLSRQACLFAWNPAPICAAMYMPVCV